MATYRAIETISDVLVRLLRASYDAADFDDQPLTFEAYLRDDFDNPMSMGASLFLYRVVVNGTQRMPPGRIRGDGTRERPPLPLDLHYLVTVWARDASMQHRIAGWVMRMFEDTPILPYGVLGAVQPDVFHPDESAEITIDDLSNEDLLRIWETLNTSGYALSIPYLVRSVMIDSERETASGEPVQERVFPIEDLSGARSS
jgi:hypothetical protein